MTGDGGGRRSRDTTIRRLPLCAAAVSPGALSFRVHRVDRRTLLVALALAAGTAALYARVTGFGFLNFDDDEYVTAVPYVRTGLGVAGVRWAFTSTEGSHWLPVTRLSHLLDGTLFGLWPGGHHLTSALLHVANVVLLFLLLRRLTGALGRSALVAALFAVHPLRVESVAWVAERKDVLSALLGLLTTWLYVGSVQAPRRGRLAWVTLAFAAALMAKPMLVTLPFMLLLLDYWPLGRWAREDRRRLVLEKAPLFVLALACGIATLAIARATGSAVVGLEGLSLGRRVATALVGYGTYLAKTVWPADLAVVYPLRAAWPPGQVVVSLALLVAITALVVARAARAPYLLVGWLWFVVGLVPVSGLLQAGAQAWADRFTYLPSVGLLVALMWGAHDLALRWKVPRAALAAAAAVAIGALAVGTWRYLGYWRSTRALFAHALAVTEGNWLAHNNLGDALVRDGEVAAAIPHFEAALRLHPVYADAHYNLGVALGLQGRLPEAGAHFERAIALDPRRVEAHYNLGVALHKLGRVDEAVVHYRDALRLQPAHPEAHYALAFALAQQGKGDEARAHYAEALRLRPDLPRVSLPDG